MSGTGRDNAGTSGSAAMGDKGGSAEVHTGLHSAGSGDQYEGLQFAGNEEGGSRSRLGGAAEAVRDRVGEGARNLAGGVGPRVARVASSTRERANRVMEQRGLLDRLRDNPLPILGVAFAIGFVLAARDDDDDDDYGTSKASRARRELRSALMGGISAGIAQGARGFLSQTNNQGSGFLAELIDGFMGGQQGGGSASGGGSSGGRTGGSTGGASGGGSMSGTGGGGSRTGTGGGGSTAGAGAAGTSGPAARGSTGGSRPPSHQENA
jgi:hypothetical protein